MSSSTSTTPATKPQPVLLIGAVTTALMLFFGGLTTFAQGNDTLSLIGGLGTLATGAINAGLAYYVRGQVVPAADVTSYVNDQREQVAGDASRLPTGTPVTEVQVDGLGQA